MYFFGLSKEEVLSQKHDVSYIETSNQNPVTLFGRQVYSVNSESPKPGDGYMRIDSPKLFMKDIDLRLPADHCPYNTVETRFQSAFEASKEKEALATNCSGNRDPRIVIDLEKLPTSWSGGKRNPKVVIDLEELPTTEDADSVSYVTVRTPETEPLCLADQISSNVLKVVDQSLVEYGSAGLLDLNTIPADELASEPHLCFLQDLNCPYIEETETSCEKSGVDDDPTFLCSPKCQNVHEKDGTESPASYTSCCTTEHNLRRGSSPPALDPSCRTRLEFPVVPDNACCNDEEEEFSEVMLIAAESLVHISAVSYQNQDKPEKGNVERRCLSCDSYELHTLGIRETNTEEEFCVSSMAMDKLNNITGVDNKEFALKLRRGRRMKNFQKEIVPSLTSLSRYEIREDMNILEAVFRSREYKKMQGKTRDVNLGAGTRDKRLVSQRYVGKRGRKHE